MGADRVIAVNVGDLSDREGVSYTMFGDRGRYARRDDARVDAGARLAAADVVINVPLDEYGSLDWRRAAELIEEGYRAAESDARSAAAARRQRSRSSRRGAATARRAGARRCRRPRSSSSRASPQVTRSG